MTVQDAANTVIGSGKNSGQQVGHLNVQQLDWYGDKEYRSGLRNQWNVAAHIVREARICQKMYTRNANALNGEDRKMAIDMNEWDSANTETADW